LLTDLLMSSLPSTRTASKFVPLQPNVAVMQRRHSGRFETIRNYIDTIVTKDWSKHPPMVLTAQTAAGSAACA